MCRVLFLTKSISVEIELEEKIRHLGHEVLCSTTLLNTIKKHALPKSFLETFQIVILSETLTNQETKVILEDIGLSSLGIIQLKDGPLTEDDHQEKKVTYMSPRVSLTELREALSHYDSPEKMGRYAETLEDVVDRLGLSKRERTLLNILADTPGTPFSRADLCQKIWNKELSLSTKCQLSNLVKRIKDKLEENELDHLKIMTVRNVGYMLKVA
ncbi:winged helix-turn-helix domain-containing protein [Enterococcus alishanensis]